MHLPSKELHNWSNNNGTHKATNGKNRNSYGPEEGQCTFIHREAIPSFPSFIVKLLDKLKKNISKDTCKKLHFKNIIETE